MRTYLYPAQAEWAALTQRPVQKLDQLRAGVQQTFDLIQQRGDAALIELAAKFDKATLSSVWVTPEEVAAAVPKVTEELKSAIELAYNNIRQFHEAQHEPVLQVETMPGVTCWRKSVGIQKVGLYIPGGSAPLFSTLLMLGIPAQIAGCRDIILATPPSADGSINATILYTAHRLGITRILKAGGAQAVAALAFGTETVPAVDKIFGPGNQYVTAAKQMVTQVGVAIDMPAGPSEVLVIADDSADPAFVAADLLSQAEHGPDSQVVLVTVSENQLQKVQAAVAEQVAQLPRQAVAEQALDNSIGVVVDSLEEALAFSNLYAPEHLILSVAQPEALAEQVTQAGSVFMGHFSPESVGDYASGTNHTLPTNGYARNYSGVSLDSFVKKITFQHLTRAGLERIGPAVEIMAEAEGLHAHKHAVTLRLGKIRR
ncbi:histidinol dehydrogenase [Rufibacter glacialis]|uniref:Histidinol dehydrogenase n=1 Tax=Rufibacter glacialis TaxID=1259555 RepID=A0A5M8QG58_9BACT|nr:histidinol dehydrogenase [Rufibacter glacialis]KAA6434218.1 histidinol dehydrogenase [Rufibacter glacialis]GGK67838.1 histidinol dehydrogenase [Rufibacter glacialis]